MTTKKQDNKKKRYLGRFTLPDGLSDVGELRLDGTRTTLTLHSDNDLGSIKSATYIRGVAFTGECLSLIDCNSPGAGNTYDRGKLIQYHANAFAHYVVVGKGYVEPRQASIRSIEFTTTDLAALFYDFDAFGHVIDASAVMPALVEEHDATMRKHGYEPRALPVGDHPQVAYFTGRDLVCEVQTKMGLVAVHHRVRYSMGSPAGVHIKNRMVVSVTPKQSVTFGEALEALHDMTCFLSAAIGCAQGVSQIRVDITEANAEFPVLLDVHPSFRIKGTKNAESRGPHPGDVPLDPISHFPEFNAVLTHWVEQQDVRRTARIRHLDCLRKANRYGPDRIVAAANMFDLLPSEATPVPAELPVDLASTRDACIAMLKVHASSPDRNSALSALGRLGKPSLPKKVAYRTSIVVEKMGAQFPSLQRVATLAVKCRNHFVHGGDDFDFERLQGFVPFLTDTLEFIFVASDFIEAGWEPKRWLSSPHGMDNQFAKFLWIYKETLAKLLQLQARGTY